ncbi:hypothetical protein BH11PLA2_BH11PLA2_32850 [soil metagenome]
MLATVTSPVIVKAIADKLKAEESLQALVGDRVFDAEPETLPAGPYLLVTPDRTTMGSGAKALQQSLINVQTVAASESMRNVILVAVQTALSGRVFDPVSTCVLHDTSPDKVTANGWHRRTDLFAAFHSPLAVTIQAPMPNVVLPKVYACEAAR